MKSIIQVAMLCILSCVTFGKIKNGYESKLEDNKELLKKLQSELEQNLLSPKERRAVKMQIKKLETFFVCYELTNRVLEQLRLISPSIHHELDVLTDKRGRETDVYVRLLSRETSNSHLAGASLFNGITSDPDASVSWYGANSVAVDIGICNRALMLLCHELGHVKYIVPNFGSYVAFYRKHYENQPTIINELGHLHDDKSGKLALQFADRYYKDWRNYLTETKNKPERITVLNTRLRHDIHGMKELNTSVASMSR